MSVQTKRGIIRNSFFCGLLTFLVNTIFTLVGDIPLILFLTNILPGFFFGSVLCMGDESLSAWRRVLFIFCSGGLYFLVVWLATDLHLSFHGQLSFILASVAGANGLFLLYRFLLEKQLVVWKGLALATITGILSSFLPAKAYFDNDFISSVGKVFDTMILMSIFLTWQTLFGLTVALSSTAVANSRLLKPRLTSNG
jgi:hypothetical protein